MTFELYRWNNNGASDEKIRSLKGTNRCGRISGLCLLSFLNLLLSAIEL